MTDEASALREILLYCRAGFETECAQDICDRAKDLGIAGRERHTPGCGHVFFSPINETDAPRLYTALRFSSLVFSRQMIGIVDYLTQLPRADRTGPIIAAVKNKNLIVGAVFVETADTEISKPILPFCKVFLPHVQQALRREGLLVEGDRARRLHLFFLTSDSVYVGISAARNASEWPMGIPRLKFPAGAPSRSTLKLEEAFMLFIDQPEREKILRPGLRAVDLGASPGGWTYQLIKRGLSVTAVDNGPLADSLLQSVLVKHIRADGFAYKPPKPVDWMVCDIVEQPAKIAKLVGEWMVRGWCRRCIFNLKLPMKKRYEELQRCGKMLRDAVRNTDKQVRVDFKQLYHDREEITGFIRVR